MQEIVFDFECFFPECLKFFVEMCKAFAQQILQFGVYNLYFSFGNGHAEGD